MQQGDELHRGRCRIWASVLLVGILAACGGSDDASDAPAAPVATATATATPPTAPTPTCSTGDCPQPALASLTVSPYELRPDFSPAISDYAVVCSPGTNQLTLDMTATAGGAVALSAPMATSWAPSASLSVSLVENQAVVVLARDAGGLVQQYWIRCLPHDFPLLVPNPHPEAGTPMPGWYFIGNLFVATGFGAYAMVIDANGTPIWYHATTAAEANPTVVTPLPDSTVGITTSSNPSIGTLYGLETSTTRSLDTVGIPLNNHELRLLPNGDYLLISYPTLTGVDLTGLQSYGPDSAMIDCAVQEVDPPGNLVWDWRASDHVDPVKESVERVAAPQSTRPTCTTAIRPT